MTNFLLLPPIVFIIGLVLVWLFSKLTSGFMPPQTHVEGKNEPYACGENIKAEKAVPEYRGFFKFAVFFTVLHVAGLMLATISASSLCNCAGLSIIYVVAVAATLAILFLG